MLDTVATPTRTPALPPQRARRALLRRHHPAADPAVLRLAGLGVLQGVPRGVLTALAPHVEHLHLPAGTRLLTECAHVRGAFLLAGGIAESRLRGHWLGEAQAGELLGDLALLRTGRSPLTWDAVTDVQVLVVAPDALRDLLQRCPLVADRVHGLADVPFDVPVRR